jgi:hypothetical protein
MSVTAYHNNPELKEKSVASMREHRRLDTLQAQATGKNGKGCAVWCILGEYAHDQGPVKVGFAPQFLHLIDAGFEGLAKHGNGQEHGDFAINILEAVPVGADTDLIWRRWMYWLLSAADSPLHESDQGPRAKAAIAGVAALYKEWLDTGVKPASERWEAEEAAARAVWAEEASARAVWAAEAAAWAAGAARVGGGGGGGGGGRGGGRGGRRRRRRRRMRCRRRRGRPTARWRQN